MSSLDRFPSIFGRSKSTRSGVGESRTANGNDTSGAAATHNNQDGSSGKSSSATGTYKKPTQHLTLEQSFEQSSFSATVDFIRHSEGGIDDRKLFLEHGLSKLSKMAPGDLSQTLQDQAIKILYNDLAHPPPTLIGNQYAWRSADGSGNNINDPDMGKAGSTYARSVQQSHPLSPSELPDPGLIFDTLLKRDGFERHPAGLSSLMFSFAALVIHTCFRTSHKDVNVNETSSYVDLSPLYGHDQETQNRVRARDGRGLLYPDVFAEDRLLLLPPAVCVLLVLFSRNHNYIAKRLFHINERGTYQDPSKLSGSELAAQEEELFQTARLINIGWFASVVFSDYLSCILGLVRQGSSWSLNPFGVIRNLDHSEFERGRGNVCSVEFNCLYRWHATTSQEDEQWTLKVFDTIFPGKTPDTLTPKEFGEGAARAMAMNPDIHHWSIGTLHRQENGMFKDEDLAQVLKDATEHPAGAFRARGTPECMRLHEIMGIMQNRKWGVCSLNDFRKFLGLKPYSTFLEWNSNPEIAYAAEKLYGDIEYLELYVGLQAEEAKPVVDGAGLCPGYTISRAILSDAIALTRGDRFFTHDYTPFNLTAWGFADCQRQPDAFGFGSTLGRLFLRTLPEEYTENSTYAFFPLVTPDAMQVFLKDLKASDQYDMKRPSTKASETTFKDYSSVGDIIKDPKFFTHYEMRAKQVVPGKGFFSCPEDRAEQQEVLKALTASSDAKAELSKFFFQKTQELIRNNSFNLSGSRTRAVDLVRDVLKPVPIYWVADIAGIQIKSSPSASGDFTAKELYSMLGDIYSYIFLDVEPARIMVLKNQVQSHVKILLQHIESGLGLSSKRLSVLALFDSVSSMFTKSKKTDEHNLVKELHKIGHSAREQANTILAIMVGSVELSVAFANMINMYLDSPHEEEIRRLAGDGKADLGGYARETLRLEPPFKGVYRIASAEQSKGGTTVQKDGRVFLDILAAGRNDQVFPDPETVNVNRGQPERYLISDGISRCLGEDITVQIMGQVLRGVFAINNLQRAPGNSGVLNRFRDHNRPELHFAYLDEKKYISPWPTSLAALYDEE